MNTFEFQRVGELAGVSIPLRVEAGILKSPRPVAPVLIVKMPPERLEGIHAALNAPTSVFKPLYVTLPIQGEKQAFARNVERLQEVTISNQIRIFPKF